VLDEKLTQQTCSSKYLHKILTELQFVISKKIKQNVKYNEVGVSLLLVVLHHSYHNFQMLLEVGKH